MADIVDDEDFDLDMLADIDALVDKHWAAVSAWVHRTRPIGGKQIPDLWRYTFADCKITTAVLSLRCVSLWQN